MCRNVDNKYLIIFKRLIVTFSADVKVWSQFLNICCSIEEEDNNKIMKSFALQYQMLHIIKLRNLDKRYQLFLFEGNMRGEKELRRNNKKKQRTFEANFLKQYFLSEIGRKQRVKKSLKCLTLKVG